MKLIYPIAGAAALALAACGGPATETATSEDPAVTTESAGTTADPTAGFADLEGAVAADYSLETNHAYLAAYVGHGGGLSRYQINFTNLDADLKFDPASPEASSLTFTVDATGVETNYPGDYKAGHADSEFDNWNEDVSRHERWLNADEHPTITFTSTSATRTGDNTGTLTGDLTLLGQTHPVTFDITYNGTGTMRGNDARHLIGFNATTTVNRSEWGMGAFVPFISDDVRIDFSGEFLQDE